MNIVMLYRGSIKWENRYMSATKSKYDANKYNDFNISFINVEKLNINKYLKNNVVHAIFSTKEIIDIYKVDRLFIYLYNGNDREYYKDYYGKTSNNYKIYDRMFRLYYEHQEDIDIWWIDYHGDLKHKISKSCTIERGQYTSKEDLLEYVNERILKFTKDLENYNKIKNELTKQI